MIEGAPFSWEVARTVCVRVPLQTPTGSNHGDSLGQWSRLRRYEGRSYPAKMLKEVWSQQGSAVNTAPRKHPATQQGKTVLDTRTTPTLLPPYVQTMPSGEEQPIRMPAQSDTGQRVGSPKKLPMGKDPNGADFRRRPRGYHCPTAAGLLPVGVLYERGSRNT